MTTPPPQPDCKELQAAKPPECPLPVWARRLGLGAFLFFLLKGLAWLAVPALAVWWRARSGE